MYIMRKECVVYECSNMIFFCKTKCNHALEANHKNNFWPKNRSRKRVRGRLESPHPLASPFITYKNIYRERKRGARERERERGRSSPLLSKNSDTIKSSHSPLSSSLSLLF